ncbi:MAG TPA: urease accessory protein UreD [Polyangiales bacterium]|nr:urease accessory protein UreD [Polyangiales bacterium]
MLSAEPDFGTWDARLALRFKHGARGTHLAETEHVGPLRVQRPFHPEGPDGPCHVYLLHPPGGVVSGDRLRIALSLDARAHAMLTAPGANKFYTARGEHRAELVQSVDVGEGALAEWMPPETIAFEGTRGALHTQVALAADAAYAGWEILCLGRPAAGEGFSSGELRTSLEIRREGQLRFLERGLYRGGDAVLRAPWGLHGQPVLATFVVASPRASQEWVEQVRAEVEVESGTFSVTLVSGVLVARFLGATTREARGCLERAFRVLRPLYAGREAVHPRIWST